MKNQRNLTHALSDDHLLTIGREIPNDFPDRVLPADKDVYKTMRGFFPLYDDKFYTSQEEYQNITLDTIRNSKAFQTYCTMHPEKIQAALSTVLKEYALGEKTVTLLIHEAKRCAQKLRERGVTTGARLTVLFDMYSQSDTYMQTCTFDQLITHLQDSLIGIPIYSNLPAHLKECYENLLEKDDIDIETATSEISTFSYSYMLNDTGWLSLSIMDDTSTYFMTLLKHPREIYHALKHISNYQESAQFEPRRILKKERETIDTGNVDGQS